MKLKVAEIFTSIHGEVNGHHQGMQTTFVRFSGCNLKCNYCDTAHTQNSNFGNYMSEKEIISQIEKNEHTHVCLTGGEPLLQDLRVLCEILKTLGFKISIETNGTMDIINYRTYVDSFVVDWKCPSTGYEKNIIPSNFPILASNDIIKFAVQNEADVRFASEAIESFYPQIRAITALSPVIKSISIHELYTLMKKYNIYNSVLSLQIHKLFEFS